MTQAERPSVTKYHVPYEQWEEAVVANAAYFTVVKFLGSCRYDRREFPTLRQALEAQKSMPDPDRWMIYAVTEGPVHSVHLDRSKYQKFLDLYERWN